MLKDMLHQLEDEPQCVDVGCNNGEHLNSIDMLTSNIHVAMTESAWENLEFFNGTTGHQARRKHTIPGWNDRGKTISE